MYGYKTDFRNSIHAGIDVTQAKSIYETRLENICYRYGSVIPSREEKRSKEVKWKNAWSNLKQRNAYNWFLWSDDSMDQDGRWSFLLLQFPAKNILMINILLN